MHKNLINSNKLPDRKKSLFIILLFYSLFTYSQYDSILYDGLNRTFLLHLPSEYSANNNYPLVVAMHGGFGSAYNLQNQSQLSTKAEAENFMVIYPEGVKSLLDIRTWNAGWCCGYASSNNTDDVGFINALLDTVINKYPVDTTRIYATGMSNGGFMCYRLACELPGRFAAIAPVAASMSMADCSPDKQLPIIHFHSYLDSSVPYSGGIGTGISGHYNPPIDSVLNVWAAINGCSVANDTLVDNNQNTHVKWSSCICGTEIQYYITRDGGHSWPGGKKTPIGDPISEYISATDLMWEFFKLHTLDCKTTPVEKIVSENIIEFFPNPTDGIIHITTAGSKGNYAITVYNSSGQVVIKKENTGSVNLKGLPQGVYFLSIIIKDGRVMKKVVKVE